MSDHPIEGMMNTTLEKIKQMVDVNSIVGDPITAPDGTIIIPISKISYGFASGRLGFPLQGAERKRIFRRRHGRRDLHQSDCVSYDLQRQCQAFADRPV